MTHGKKRLRIKVCFYDCFGTSTAFTKYDVALAAAKKYSDVKKYPTEPFWCEKCLQFHIRPQEKTPRSVLV